MSLFNLKEWWATQLDPKEEFDIGSLAVGNLDNASDGDDKIAVGSLQGIIRVFSPQSGGYSIDNLLLEEDLGHPILQLKLGRLLPSLSDRVGIAVLHPKKLTVYELVPQGSPSSPGSGSGSNGNIINSSNGGADQSVGGGGGGLSSPPSHYKLEKCYDHALGVHGEHFTACNMVIGPFGGARNKDLIAVQAMDGRLQIFDQDAHAFTRQLPDILLPGPVAYVDRLDAFVTVNNARNVVAFRYHVLAAASSTDDDSAGGGGVGGGGGGGGGAGAGALLQSSSSLTSSSSGMGGGAGGVVGTVRQGVTSVRKANAEWSTSIGEFALDMVHARCTRSLQSGIKDLVVIGDQTLFLLREQGGIRSQRRFDCSPSCMHVYRADIDSNIMIGTHERTLNIFRDNQLVWVSRIRFAPIAIHVCTFGGQRGLMACLSATGDLLVGYIGTHTSLPGAVGSGGVGGGGGREVDYESIDAEHKKLLQVIRESQMQGGKSEPTERLSLKVQFPMSNGFPCLDPPHITSVADAEDGTPAPRGDDIARIFSGMGGGGGQVVRMSVRLFLSFSGRSGDVARNVQITSSLPHHILMHPPETTNDMVRGSTATPTVLTLTFFASPKHLPSSRQVTIIATYTTESSSGKQASFKITVDTNKAPVSLMQLFPDMIDPAITSQDMLGPSAAKALGFAFYSSSLAPASSSSSSSTSSQQCSVLVSKDSGRYRIQADTMGGVALLLQEILERLKSHFQPSLSSSSSKGGPPPASRPPPSSSSTAGNEDSEPLVLSFGDDLPAGDYLQTLESHFQCRKLLHTAHADLNDGAMQLRMIQKRILARLKEKSPFSMEGGGLSLLFDRAYDHVMTEADQVSSLQDRLRALDIELTCAGQVLTLLTALKLDMSDDECNALRRHMCVDLPAVAAGATLTGAGDEQGWEEVTEASMTWLLKTALSARQGDNNNKDRGGVVTINVEMPDDTSKLRKYIGFVLDRLGRGGRILQNQKERESAGGGEESKDSI